ncbi:MAG: OB-fold nucleic acid binding domain-containing protein [Methanobacterium sp.]|uniref:OB-fold nucleic acid binding domain-containing protein n=1 Tax=Methanobacterium sp. TaxID=2164 RepID=UPI003C7121B2
MEDRCILKIVFIVSIFGIIATTIFSGQITPNNYQINEINLGMLDQKISVEGVVDNIKESPDKHTYFLELMDNTGKINLVIFGKEAEDIERNNINVNNLLNRRIKILGTVTEYNGNLELILKDSKSLKIIA